MTSTIAITPLGHWLSAWYLRLFTTPIVLVDGHEHPARWGRPTEIVVETGDHRVALGARHRGFTHLGGVLDSTVEVRPGTHVEAIARNGFFNHDPFVVRVVSERPAR